MKERHVEGLTAGRRGTSHGVGGLLGDGAEPRLTGTPALSKQEDGWTDVRMGE